MRERLKNKEIRRKDKLLDLVSLIVKYKGITHINWKGKLTLFADTYYDIANEEKHRDRLYHHIHTDPVHFFRCLGFDPIILKRSRNTYEALFSAFVAYRICNPPYVESKKNLDI